MNGRIIAAFGAGLLFAVGLGISGMTLPAKVIGFLDFFGDWDPSLALVMGGAVGVHLLLHRLVVRRPRPLLAERFVLPERRDLDRRLVGGSALFGVGWGMGGFCPGPAIVGVVTLLPAVLLFVAGMVLGIIMHQALPGATDREGAAEPPLASTDCG